MSLPLILSHWVHDLNPVIIEFTDRFAIRWYGLAYVTAFFLGWFFLRLYHEKGRSPFDAAGRERLLFALVLGVFIGGRLGYMLLYAFGDWIRDPLLIFRLWEGGMASHGGFAGVFIAVILASRRAGVSPLQTGDLIVTIAPAGLFLGRMANFINGELWGKVSQLPWAVIFPGSASEGTPLELIAPRHPSQIYQALGEGLIPFLYLQWRFWKSPPGKIPHGQLAGEFYLLYAFMRILTEQFREPDAALIAFWGLSFSRGTFYSFFIALIGIGLIVVAQLMGKKQAAKTDKGE